MRPRRHRSLPRSGGFPRSVWFDHSRREQLDGGARSRAHREGHASVEEDDEELTEEEEEDEGPLAHSTDDDY